jgi:aspartyl-tRNA(Asn)/glutamyl-tRNA(Gln) amidotransferase subunit B
MSSSTFPAVTPDVLARYETVIGLEVHVQLSTATKMFCSCLNNFGSDPNANTCPVCLGLPGALPVANRHAVELAVRAALALNCQVRPFSRFARKNYFYPDMPKGYQISQFDQPLAEHGWVDVVVDGNPRRIGITRVHMEDDAGKSVHDGYRDSDRYSYVDLNRSGTPLIEIVSEPDMRSPDEAYAYITELKQTLEFLYVSTCDMEKGHLRCDANVSVRLRGAGKLGTRAEIKNLNSFRFLKEAIEYEVVRQIALIEEGGTVRQETRLYTPETGETAPMRGKESAHDYRYFPEPDLVPLRISEAWLAEAKASIPELPSPKRARFIADLGLAEYDAGVLTASRPLSDYFEAALSVSGNPKITANWVMGDLLGALKAEGKEIVDSPVSAVNLGKLVKMIVAGELSGKLAKEIFPKMLSTGDAPETIAEREGLRQISDTDAIGKMVDEVIAASPKQVEQYRGGKTTVINYLVGQVMRATRGQASVGAVTELLKQKLG